MVKVSKDRIVLVLVFALVFLAFQASLSDTVHAKSNFYVASLNQDIDPGAEDFVVSSINDATSAGIHSFILILNTNGGSGSNMENIISAISNYEGAGNTFYTLVAPASAHAFSAGAYIAEASNNITMIPGTLIGSATPIVSGIPTGEENTTLTKDINAFTTYMVALTKHNGRNWNATALMVTKGVSYECGTVTSCTALKQGVIDTVLPANNTQQALTMMRAGDATIHTPGTRSIFLSIISDPNLDSVLFLAGVFAILADLYHPTLIVTVIGGALVALALLGLGVFGAPLVSIILMMIVAIFIFSLPSSAPAPPGAHSCTFFQATVLTYTVLGLVGGGGVLGSIYLYRVREAMMHRPPSQNPKAIIGKQGRLTSDLSAGATATANIGSEDYTVTGAEDLHRGSQVRVKDVQGLRLVVEKVEA